MPKNEKSNSRTVEFIHDEETKGAHRYKEVNDEGEQVEYKEAVIGTLYLRKTALGDGAAPKKVKATISW